MNPVCIGASRFIPIGDVRRCETRHPSGWRKNRFRILFPPGRIIIRDPERSREAIAPRLGSLKRPDRFDDRAREAIRNDGAEPKTGQYDVTHEDCDPCAMNCPCRSHGLFAFGRSGKDARDTVAVVPPVDRKKEKASGNDKERNGSARFPVHDRRTQFNKNERSWQ